MTVKYRRLDSNHDYMFGQNLDNFATNVDAVAQAVLTRLLLFKGEWWEDINDGLPLFQSILGAPGSNIVARDFIIQDRIKQTEGVDNIESWSSSQNPNNGAYTFQVVINTIYGTVYLTNGG